jgi:hypothetical protein
MPLSVYTPFETEEESESFIGISVHCSGRGWSNTLEERGRGRRHRAHRRGVHAVRWEQSSSQGGGGPVRGRPSGRRGRDASRAEEDRHGRWPSGRVGRRQGVAEGGQRRRPEATTCDVAGRGQRPDAAARAHRGQASLAADGGAERCGGSASWPVAARGSSVWRRRECG